MTAMALKAGFSEKVFSSAASSSRARADERASGFLFFVHGSGWRRLIHGFKYRGAWRMAREMGAWYGRHLRESGLYDDVEVVVPLPLHPFRRCRRGYNQSEYLAEGIASQLGVGVDRRSVRRRRNTPSQTLRSRRDRARNGESGDADAAAGRGAENLGGAGEERVACGHHVIDQQDMPPGEPLGMPDRKGAFDVAGPVAAGSEGLAGR